MLVQIMKHLIVQQPALLNVILQNIPMPEEVYTVQENMLVEQNRRSLVQNTVAQ